MKILLIEDEQSVSSFIKKGLNEQGHEVIQAFDGEIGIRMASQHAYNLIILDIILPGMNGLEVCKKIRELGDNTPILMLTALGTSDDIVTGLDTGADDYLIKPFKFKELVARVKALGRRTNSNNSGKSILKIADLEMDLDSKTVTRNNQLIKLTAREFNLLEYFIRNKDRVVSRVDILENVWEVNFDLGTNVIDVYVNYLRNKIDKDFSTKLIHTIIGMGYVLKES